MSKYEKINCECGTSYLTKESSAVCPNCNKRNMTPSSSYFAIALIIGVFLLIGIMFGAIIWLYLAKNENNRKWHYLGATLLSLLSIIIVGYILDYDDYPVMNWITYISNSIALVYGSIMFFRLRKA